MQNEGITSRLIKVKKNCVSYLEKILPRGRVSYKKERETRQMLEEGRYKKTGRERGENSLWHHLII